MSGVVWALMWELKDMVLLVLRNFTIQGGSTTVGAWDQGLANL
jgi:hypothetical protein